MVVAGIKYTPVTSFNKYFNRYEKEIMKAYRSYCEDVGYNVGLKEFCQDLYNDFFFGNQICRN